MKNNLLHDIPDYDGIGVYAIINDRTGKMYIGSSKNVKKRLLQHKHSFEIQKCSAAFKEDIQNGDTFSACVLEEIEYGANQFHIFGREQYYIQLHNTLSTGYNSAKTTALTKKELLHSLSLWQHNPSMSRYIENIIKKRETPIYKDTVFKNEPLEPYRSFRSHVPESVFNLLQDHLQANPDEDINTFIARAITETVEHDNLSTATQETEITR